MNNQLDNRAKKAELTANHVRHITEQQLNAAVRQQRTTGRKLWEILLSDLSVKSIKDLLTYNIAPKGQPLRDVILESGWATEKELGEAVAEESGGLKMGERLIDKGFITRAQLGQALIEQERTGYTLGRVLLNLGFINAKQLTDMTRSEIPSKSTRLRREQIVEGVLKQNLLSKSQLDELVKEAETGDIGLVELLIKKGGFSSEQIGKVLEDQLGVPYLSVVNFDVPPDVAAILPESLARSRRVLPLEKRDNTLLVAMADPEDVMTIDDLAMITGYQIEPRLVWDRQLKIALDRAYQSSSPTNTGAGATADESAQQAEGNGAERMEHLIENVSVVNLVASIVEGAVRAEATDVHLEPQTGHMRVRYRIDGMLYDVMTIPENITGGLVSRIKILASMDITQKRVPQDGHFSLELGGRKYDLRIATLPTSLGERVVIRLLNPGTIFLGLKQLGLAPDDLSKLESLIHQPNGMLLVSGPMGSGKTTTLYAALNQINVLTDSIVTIEDPIEYELPGINQVQVDLRIDRTFATVLRAVLRQDVNTMLVGEIRDMETAKIAVRAAVTGHLLFTTMHTRNAVGAITTLLNLDVPRFLVTTSIVGIVNQRLVRKLCPYCQEEYTPDAALLHDLGLESDDTLTFARPKGCPSCYHTGYHGRIGIFEILLMSDRIKAMILGHASEDELRKVAVEEGMNTLHHDALFKLKNKITSAEEVMRTVSAHLQ
jgi:type IV pilus assembly protein PilB